MPCIASHVPFGSRSRRDFRNAEAGDIDWQCGDRATGRSRRDFRNAEAVTDAPARLPHRLRPQSSRFQKC